MKEPLLKADRLEMRFGNHILFQNLSFEGCSGEKIAIVGPSGSGKSTLLHILATLEKPTQGQVHLLGEKASHTAQIRRQIGVIFQAFYLLEKESVLDNLLLPARINNLPLDEALERAHTYLKKMGMEAHSHQQVCHLSGGEKRRLSLIRALISQPKIIFADEVTSNLDAAYRDLSIELLSDYCRIFKALLVFATHDLEFAAQSTQTLSLGTPL